MSIVHCSRVGSDGVSEVTHHEAIEQTVWLDRAAVRHSSATVFIVPPRSSASVGSGSVPYT